MIPYFQSNEELLISLNSVIRKAQHVERESINRVHDLEAELRSCKESIKQLEKELEDIKAISKDKTFERFVHMSEENARLVKELNISKYKLNSNEEVDK